MSTKRTDILNYIANTLLPSITTGNGYLVSIVKTGRGLPHYGSLMEGDFPAVFVASADEARENVTHKDFKSTIRVFVEGYVYNSEPGDRIAEATKIQEDLDVLIGEITKAFYKDPLLAGNVTWLDITAVETDDGSLTPHGIFRMTIDAFYKSQCGNP